MFEELLGRNQGKAFEDPLTRRGVQLWLERVDAYYGPEGGVDIEVIDGQLGLCAKTAEYIYSDFTPPETKYVPGSRPLLEKTLAEVTRPEMSAREKALAIMRRCRDNRDRGLASPNLFFGGTEEELLKRGALMCNEVSRIFACLCQIAGLPARLHCSHISGHMMAEVLTDGKWGWVDPMKGIAPVTDDGGPASVWDLLQDPQLFERQPESVWDDCRSPVIYFGTEERDPRNSNFCMIKNRDCYFNAREATAIGNYFVWEHGKYSYPWTAAGGRDPQGIRDAAAKEMLNRKKLGWPDWYFEPLLLDEELKPR